MAGETVVGIRLTADGSGFVGAVNVSRDSLKGLRDEASKMKPATESSFGGATAAIKSFLGVAAAGSLAHFVSSISAADAELVDLSKKTGIAVEELSRYDRVAALTGKSMNDLADYSVKLGQNIMNGVEKPSSEAARAMKALGFSSEEMADMMQHPDEALQKVAKRMSEFDNGTEKSAVALALFGRQGKDVMPVLDDIAEHTREVGAVSQEQADRSKLLADNFELSKVRAQELGREFLNGLLPSVVNVTNAFSDMSSKTGAMEAFGEGVGTILKGIATAATITSAAMKNIGIDIAFLVQRADALTSLNWDGVDAAWALRHEMIDESNKTLEVNIDRIWAVASAEKGSADAMAQAYNKRNGMQQQQLQFSEKNKEAIDKNVKAAEDFIKKLQEEVDALGMDESAKKRAQAANLGVAKSAEPLIAKLEEQKKKTEAVAQALKLLDFEAKKHAEWLKNIEVSESDLNKIRTDALKTAEEHLSKLQLETELMQLSNEEKEVRIALLEAEKNRVGMTTEEYEKYIQTVEKATRNKVAIEASIKAQEELRKEWQKTGDQIEQALTDALVRAIDEGENAWNAMLDYFKNMAKTLVVKIPIQWIMGSLGGAMGGSSSSGLGGLFSMFGGGGSGGGLFSGLGSLFSDAGSDAGGSFFNTFSSVFSSGLGSLFGGNGVFSTMMGGGSGGLAAMFAGSGLGQSMGLSTALMGPTQTGAALGGSALTGAGSSFTSMIPVIGWILAGMMTSSNLYAQGWQPENDDTTARIWGGNIPGSSTDVLSRVFGDRWGSILSGGAIQSRLFGHKKPELRDSGVQGTFSSDGFEGEMFWDTVARGGVFRGDKWRTDTAPMDRELQRAIDDTIGKVPSQIADLLSEFGKDFDDVFGPDWAKWQQIVLADGGDWEEMGKRLDEATVKLYREMSTTAVESIRTGWGEYVSDLEGLEPEEFQAEIRKILGSLNVLENGDIQEDLFGVSGLAEADFSAVADAGELIYETIARVSDAFAATNRLGKLTGINFAGVGLASTADRQAMVDDAGGLDALAELTSSYWNTFATPTEQFAAAGESLRDVFDEMGMSIPHTVEGYRALVAAQDMSTEEGRQAALDLMQTAGLWQQSAGVFETIKNSFSDSINDMRRSFEFDGLTSEEKYSKLKTEADSAYVDLQSATDPREIQRLLDLIKNDMNAAWGLLGDDQKNDKRDEYLARLDELESMGLSRIDVAADEYLGVQAAEENIAVAGNTLAEALLGVADQLGMDISGVVLKPLADIVDQVPDEMKPAPEMFDAMLTLKPLIENALANEKPMRLEDAFLALQPLLKESSNYDPSESVQLLESALKPMLLEQGDVNQEYLTTLQGMLDRINSGEVMEIDTAAVSRELEGSGKKIGDAITTSVADMARTLNSASVMMAAALATPQRHIIEVAYPSVQRAEAN